MVWVDETVMAAAIKRSALLGVIVLSLGGAAHSSARACSQSEKFLLLAEGDSITAGQTSTDGQGSYVERAANLKKSQGEIIVSAVSRAVLGSPGDPVGANSLYGRMSADNAILAHKKSGRVAILSVLIGRNDLVGAWGGPAGYLQRLSSYLATMRRAGWDRLVVGTLLPSAWPPFEEPRNEFNGLIKVPGWAPLHGVDVIADFAASKSMGDLRAAQATTFFSDGIHPNNRGYQELAGIFDKAVAQARCEK